MNASITGPLGVTLRRGHHTAFFTHTAIDNAPLNWDIVGGVIATDDKGREWVLDEAWLADYRAALKSLATTRGTAYTTSTIS